MNCKHKNYRAEVDVSRLVDNDEITQVVGYRADIRIHCTDCGQPFEFIGMPAGMLLEAPTVNVDGTELRVPIRPSTDPVEVAKAILRPKGGPII